jgi:hypothetical protein
VRAMSGAEWPALAQQARAALLGLGTAVLLWGCDIGPTGPTTPTPTRAEHVAAGDREVCQSYTVYITNCTPIGKLTTCTSVPITSQSCHWERP